MEFVTLYWFEIAAGLAALGLFIHTLALSRRLKSYKKLTTLLQGGSLEEFICRLEERSKSQQQLIADLSSQIASLQAEVAAYPHCWHLLRYNAFDNTGSNLSFSLALLNARAEGFVLTSIFGREDSRVYAKPVVGGKSDYTLSEEEIRAIKIAMGEKVR
jgi:hypothetical protein